jgi:hypothetical protein
VAVAAYLVQVKVVVQVAHHTEAEQVVVRVVQLAVPDLLAVAAL